MKPQQTVVLSQSQSALATNKVLRSTYFLLSLTLLFSGVTAGIAMTMQVTIMNPFLYMIGFFGLYFLTISLRNSAWGIASVFAFTGFIGYALGPILNFYIKNFSNGPALVTTSLVGTGVIFLALSAYVLTTKKDFSFLGGFLFVAILVGIVASLGAMIFNIPTLEVIVSGAFILIASGLILFDTSRIINGGETNYIMATIQLYVDIYILFVNLLQLLSIFGGQRN